MKYPCHTVNRPHFGRGTLLALLTLGLHLAPPALLAQVQTQVQTQEQIQIQEQVWVAGWRELAPMNTARAGAAIVTAGDRVYAIGGIDGTRFLKSVESARILADGTLAPWEPMAPIREERGFFDAVVSGGYIYIAGGGNGDGGKNLLRSIERAAIRADGRLASWERLDVSLIHPRRCVKLALSGRFLYAIGGFGGILLDSVERAEILPDGKLGPFRLETEKTTIPRYVNEVESGDGIIYVIGGHAEKEGVGIAAVEYARTDGNGAALRWQTAAPMTRGRYALGAARIGDALYALGGLDGPVYVDAVESAFIDENGVPRAWRADTDLPSPRANFGVFTHGKGIYLVGGANRDGYFRTVEYAERGDDGTLGFRASEQEATAHLNARLMAEMMRDEEEDMPHEGTVLEVIQASVYTYLRVDGPAGAQWIAGPQGEYLPGQRIHYSRGTPMENFYSRALERSFERILFVENMTPSASP